MLVNIYSNRPHDLYATSEVFADCKACHPECTWACGPPKEMRIIPTPA
jgi:hypothetical protein